MVNWGTAMGLSSRYSVHRVPSGVLDPVMMMVPF